MEIQPQPLTIQEIEQRAKDVLVQHGLFSIPVDPVVLSNNLGIVVRNAQFSNDQLSGMIAKRGENVAFFINQSHHPYRKRFTIAHELGHHFLHLLNDGDHGDSIVDLFRGDEVEGDPSQRAEVQANQFGAALLMPGELVRQHYAQYRNLGGKNAVRDLARLFNVSESAMGYRLARLRLDA